MVRLRSISIRNFRNIHAADVELGPRLNVISGGNGQGKTSFIEAVYLLATSKSFRATKPIESIARGADIASVRGRVTEDDLEREQSVGLRRGGRVARIDGKTTATLAEYAVTTPAVVFHPAGLALTAGPSAERRRLMDRVALYTDPTSLVALEQYRTALKARQKALVERGATARDAEHWEALMVEYGGRVMASRARAVEKIADVGGRAFEEIATPGLSMNIAYGPSASSVPSEYREALVKHRAADIRRGSASIGPHRDDIDLKMQSVPVRGAASQGEHRALVLALKIAEIEAISEARGVRPMLLLDDVSSELDVERTAALFKYLGTMPGQVYVTTTRPDLIDTKGIGAHRVDFVVRSGVIA